MPFRIAVGQFKELTPEDLSFCKQLGVSGITVNRPDFDGTSWKHFLGKHYPYGPADFAGSTKWDFMDLVNLRNRIEEAGLSLEAIENVPYRFFDNILIAGPRRDAQIDAYCETIRNVGRAGIRILGYHFAPNLVWRTSTARPGRGGARVTAFNFDDAVAAPPTHGRQIDGEELWENYEYFLTRVLPAAREAKVRLSLHPDDPPIGPLGGIARIMSSMQGFERAAAIAGGPDAHGFTFCVGTWTQMGGDVVYRALETFSRRGLVCYVHLRNVKGAVPDFAECFVDEGDVDVVRIVTILKETAFDGFIIDDHVPQMVADTPWGHRGRAYSTGYLAGLCRGLGAI